MRALLLTLGHNSSACLVEDGELVWGYETERITGKKSDSHMPEAVMDLKSVKNLDMAYVTHWAPDGALSSMSAKHWMPELLDGVPIRTLNPDRTHHDTHIAAAKCYAGAHFPYADKTIGLVVDGFGTYGEHFSVYDLTGGRQILLKRVHGYDTSLGLWYQYATAFMGMQMHQDEYKLLGYEVHAPVGLLDRLDKDASKAAEDWIERMSWSPYGSQYDPMYDLGALANVKQEIFNHLLGVVTRYNVVDPTSFEGRALLSYYVQAVLENVILTIVDTYSATNLICSGGVFYNVKLNKRLVDRTKGKICIYPLAGDQGNAIGLYYMDHPTFRFPDDLNWGDRTLRSMGDVEGLTVTSSFDGMYRVIDAIEAHGYVNLVRGPMEFGPRAMCNTSTLALPTKANVERINRANDRNTVMPMAPVMTRDMYASLFLYSERLWRSESHMITALEYKDTVPEHLRGIAHAYKHPFQHETGRPQVIDDTDMFLRRIIQHFNSPLINTSFNFHGQPIAFDMPSVIHNHRLQRQRDPQIQTVVIHNG